MKLLYLEKTFIHSVISLFITFVVLSDPWHKIVIYAYLIFTNKSNYHEDKLDCSGNFRSIIKNGLHQIWLQIVIANRYYCKRA